MTQQQTILIVDDMAANIEVLAEALQDDYNIFFAISGEDGIEIAIEQKPDLILMDIMMPGMNGYDVCKVLKNSSHTKNIPVVFITAMGEDDDETLGLEVGAIDYIRKPISIPIVKARVKNHMELKRSRDLLEKLSTLDGLTGIPNRRRFDEFLENEWKRSKRYQLSLSLLMIDIDYFKQYNDTYGHLKGDECLKTVAKVLTGTIKRAVDLVSRFGGEEFACILADTRYHDALNVASKIQKRIKDLCIAHSNSEADAYLTISIGVATMRPAERDENPLVLIQAADRLLYAAKSEGRNRIKGEGDS